MGVFGRGSSIRYPLKDFCKIFIKASFASKVSHQPQASGLTAGLSPRAKHGNHEEEEPVCSLVTPPLNRLSIAQSY